MSLETLTFTVSAEAAGQRLDQFLAAAVEGLSRAQAKKAVDEADVLLDGGPAKSGERLKAGAVVTLHRHPPAALALTPEAIPLPVVYEDEHLLVLDKPAGLVTHPARGHWSGTLVNALLAHCTDLSGIGGVLRPGIVHRLDRDTTGLLVVAKNDLAHQSLAAQIAERTAHRGYLAVVYGDPAFTTTVVDAPLARHPQRREEMAVIDGGRHARTQLTCRERFGLAALLEAGLETGRTHQVRVHCAHLGHPLLGDRTYGRRRQQEFRPLPPAVADAVAALPGQALHAFRLTFAHPLDGRAMAFETEPPPVFTALLAALRTLTAP